MQIDRGSLAPARATSLLRRKLLVAAINVLSAEILLSTLPLVSERLNKAAGRPTEGPEFPGPVEPGKSAAEKAINQVPLAEVTKARGLMVMTPFGGETSESSPYGSALQFQDLTIAWLEKVERGDESYVWIALAMPGERLSRQPLEKSVLNFDGSRTEQYIYTGFTAWVLVDRIGAVQPGSAPPNSHISRLIPRLRVGEPLTIRTSINQRKATYQRMNRDSVELLEKHLGRPNSDRSDQAFRFRADFVTRPEDR